MSDRAEAGPAPTPIGPRSSILRVAAELGTLGLGLSLLAYLVLRPASTKPAAAPAPVAVVAPAPAPARKSTPSPKPAPVPPAPIEPDRAAIAKAEAAVDLARRDRAMASDRAAERADALRAAGLRAAGDSFAVKAMPANVRDPSVRLLRAEQKVAELKADRQKLDADLRALAVAPRPRKVPIADQSPVARTSDEKEIHFEVRRDRVAFIEMDRLIEKVTADARQRLGSAAGMGGVGSFESKVGPVGSFSMTYAVGRTLPSSIDDMFSPGGSSVGLVGFEIVPTGSLRGESYESAVSPLSELSRALKRVNPTKTTVTLWIYPDGFALYRRLRDVFHQRGFLVAARPLPEGMPIRGSPYGTLSASQ